MKNLTKNSLNYGIEVEGAFKSDFAEELEENWGELRGDGSVNFGGLDFDDYVESEEFVSKILSYQELKKVLGLFNSKVFFSNSSCGLHLHISVKQVPFVRLVSSVMDYEFIKKQQDIFSIEKKVGKFQANRLGSGNSYNSNNYCNKFHSINDVIHRAKTGEKYSFVRVHNRWSTLEWRFFYPYRNGKKNLANIQLFLDGLLKQLNKVSSDKKEFFCSDEPKQIDYSKNGRISKAVFNSDYVFSDSKGQKYKKDFVLELLNN